MSLIMERKENLQGSVCCNKKSIGIACKIVILEGFSAHPKSTMLFHDRSNNSHPRAQIDRSILDGQKIDQRHDILFI